MKMKSSWMSAMLVACAFLVFTSCKDDDDGDTSGSKGQVQFQITDAPSDDANIKSVFVTVADIKVDGQSVSGFTKQTIDLKAYQKGNTKVLGTSDVAAKSYSNVTLVIDTETSDSGTSPGSYVQTQDGAKFKLTNSSVSSGKLEITLNKDYTIQTGAKSTSVMDFDLRKALTYSTDATTKYRFATNSNLQSAVRIVSKENTGTIKGTYSEQAASNADLVIVYAYKKGTFTATETQAQGEDNIAFKNAVSSAKVDINLSGNTYVLPFIDAGEYELRFASYGKDALSDRFIFKSLLQSDVLVSGSVSTSFTVQAGNELSVSAVIKGIIN